MSRNRIVALAAAAAVVISTAVVIIVRVVAAEPQDVVRAYLEAARRGDVAAAMAAAGVEHPPTGSGAALLTSGKPPVPWDVVAIRKAYNKYQDEADVDALISDGTWSVEGRFELRDSGGRWRITNPFATLNVWTSPLRYALVNGRRLPAAGPQQVLPGVYVQTVDQPGLVRAADTTHVLAIPTYADQPFQMPQRFLPEAAAQQRFQQLSNAYLDRCLIRSGCVPQAFLYQTTAGHYIDRARKLTWHVVRYPQVVLPGTVGATGNGLFFEGRVAVPGVLSVDGVDERGEKATSRCMVGDNFFKLTAWVDATGALQAGWSGGDTHLEVECRVWKD